MKIALDIDGVLADFVTPFLQLLERRVGGPSIDPASITDPNFQHHPFLTKELVYDCMVDTSYDAEFWRGLSPLPSLDQWQALNQVSRANQVVFITHRFTQEVKSQLVQKLAVELFVDDRHENCEDVANQTEAVVMMPHRPYNRAFTHPKVQRIQDLDELFAYLGSGITAQRR